jgi:hypothetical protein
MLRRKPVTEQGGLPRRDTIASPIEPVDAVDAQWFLLAQQDEQPAVAEALVRLRSLASSRNCARRPESGGWRAIPDHLAIGVDDCAGPPF